MKDIRAATQSRNVIWKMEGKKKTDDCEDAS